MKANDEVFFSLFVFLHADVGSTDSVEDFEAVGLYF